MIIEGLHEKGIFKEQYPFRLVVNTEEAFQYPLHWHNAVELVYNESGLCRLNISGKEASLYDGDLLLIPAGEVHEIIECSNNGKRYFIQFNISYLDGFGGINDIRPFMEKLLKISYDDNPVLQSSLEKYVLELVDEYEKKDYAYALSLNARIFDIIVIISRSLALKNDYEGAEHKPKKRTALKQINKAFEYIQKNYPSDITLKDISSAVGFSEYHFSRLFKEYTGMTFLSFLNNYRAKQAEKLLRLSDKPILDVALECGFNSLTTFNRIFKRFKGCSPTFYRKACL